jgi:hypothetical protein
LFTVSACHIILTMPALTRRRDPEVRGECWHIYFGDVRVGTIAIKSGAPSDVDQWVWVCGFYPGSHPGEQTTGSVPDFERARADFEVAWRNLFGQAHGGGLSSLARRSRLDELEICNVGCRPQDADANAGRHRALLLRGNDRHCQRGATRSLSASRSFGLIVQSPFDHNQPGRIIALFPV